MKLSNISIHPKIFMLNIHSYLGTPILIEPKDLRQRIKVVECYQEDVPKKVNVSMINYLRLLNKSFKSHNYN